MTGCARIVFYLPPRGAAVSVRFAFRRRGRPDAGVRYKFNSPGAPTMSRSGCFRRRTAGIVCTSDIQTSERHSPFRRARCSRGSLVNRIQCSRDDHVESWSWSSPSFSGEGEGSSVTSAAPGCVTPPALFAVNQLFMSAAMRSCPAFLMASDRFNPGGSFLARARASAARAAQS
jgi:hypothetical protein